MIVGAIQWAQGVLMPASLPPFELEEVELVELEEIELVQPLRKGNMGEVWLGRDTFLDRPVAVKFIADPDDARRQRFITEGRAIARLVHPNVVVVYSAGRLNGEPCLVCEYAPGTPLDELSRPLSRERLLNVGAGLARGLAAAHSAGILHRDIKPSNAVLTDSGEVKLLDFGLAKFYGLAAPTVSDVREDDVSQPGKVVGTVFYMAPECLRGEPATPSSDVYSLGAVLHDLYSTKPPSRDRSAQELVATDPALGRIIDRCLRDRADERYASAGDLVAALAALLPGARPAPEKNPYRGLRPFDEEHRSIFFGREREACDVVERMREAPLVLVAGDSGIGKSSLCRAGVLPRLREDPPAEGRVSVLSMVPGRLPVRALAEALAPLRSGTATDVERDVAWLTAEPSALPRGLPIARDVGLTVFFVDQLEELFTLAEENQAALFARALAAVASSRMPLRVLGAVRGDFFTRLAALPGLGDLVPDALFLLRPLGPERLRETVVAPAEATGVRFESSEMVDALVSEASRGAGGLPLLEFTMAELWEARDVEAKQIRATTLKQLGGVAGALARHADEVIARLLPEQRTAARRVLLRLVTVHGTRARASAHELCIDRREDATALGALVRGRLVVATESEGGATEYELAHEALLARWGTLREWIESDGDRRHIRARIASAAAEWQRLGRRGETLWDRAHLQEAARIDLFELETAQREFLDASARRLQKSRRMRAVLLASGPMLAVAVLLGIRWQTQAALRHEATARFERGMETLRNAGRLDASTARSRDEVLAAFAASRTSGDWNRAQASWSTVDEQRAAADALYDSAELAFESALAIDPTHSASRSGVAEALAKRRLLARRFGDRAESARLGQRILALTGSRTPEEARPASVLVDVDPRDAAMTLAPVADASGVAAIGPAKPVGRSPATVPDLLPGSYLLAIISGGREVRFPFLAEAGEEVAAAFRIPTNLPDGFVFVPPGRFSAGFGGSEALRRALNAPPAHEVVVPAYLIGRHEVTFLEYVAFLDALPARERAPHTPFHRSNRGSLQLRKGPAGWELLLQPTVHEFHARWGSPIRYPKRAAHSVQDWRRFPVSAISLQDAEAYAQWLSRTRIRGAHICDDHEWEKAARGADGRMFTTGRRKSP